MQSGLPAISQGQSERPGDPPKSTQLAGGRSRIKPNLPTICFLGFSPPRPQLLSFLLFVSENCSGCPLQNSPPPSPPPSGLSPLLQAGLPSPDPSLPSRGAARGLGVLRTIL